MIKHILRLQFRAIKCKLTYKNAATQNKCTMQMLIALTWTRPPPPESYTMFREIYNVIKFDATMMQNGVLTSFVYAKILFLLIRKFVCVWIRIASNAVDFLMLQYNEHNFINFESL